MNAVDTLRRQLTWNDWANGEVVRSLRAAGDATALSRRVTYRNTQGEHFTNEAGDILAHVVLHGATPRGQSAAARRAAGGAPARTDFILAVRQGGLDRS